MRLIINLTLLLFTSSVMASPTGCEARLLKSDNSVFVLEAITDQVTISRDKNQVAIANLGYNNEPGKPCLPVKGLLLSIPAYAEFNVEVLEQEVELIENIYIAPNPTPIFKDKGDEIDQVKYEFKKDVEVYGSNNFFPDKLVELNYPGFMRDCYLLQVRINLVQYNPVTNILKIYRRIKFKLNQVDSEKQLTKNVKKKAYRDESSPVFDQILDAQLLNHSVKRIDAAAQSLKMERDTRVKFEAVEFYRRIVDLERCKITVSEDGIYKLTYSDLMAAGLNLTTINPRKIHLYNRGKQVAILVQGENDGRFDESDYILFYGEANRTFFSYDNVYWLVINKNGGLRIAEKDGRPKFNGLKRNNFKTLIHTEKDSIYRADMINRSNQDHWLWDKILPHNSKEFKILTSGLDMASHQFANVKIMLYGDNYLKHAAKILLNKIELADTTWRGNCLICKSFQQSLLEKDENIIAIEPYRGDYTMLDWIEIEYWRAFSAYEDILVFSPRITGNYVFDINGFSADSIEVFELRENFIQFRIENKLFKKDSTGYSLKFQLEIDSTSSFICIDKKKFLSPQTIIQDTPSRLSSTQQQNDYIIITHEHFYNKVQPISDFHHANGLSVITVDVQDIYDEFNYGVFDTKAIKNFLQYAYYFWQTPVAPYVLLVGDASYDYKDNLNIGIQNYVPTHLFEDLYHYTETASDNWFVCVSGEDIVPDMYIGRLPVKNEIELDAIIQKDLSYSKDYTNHSWKNSVVMISDNSKIYEIDGHEFSEDFEGISNEFSLFLPQDYYLYKVYLKDFSSSVECKEKIVELLNKGCLIANYIGHGDIDQWASEQIFTIQDINKLNNRYKLPLLLAFTCQNGMFHYPEQNCLAETFLKKNDGGAVAVCASTGYADLNELRLLGRKLYSNLFNSDDIVVGSVINQAILNFLYGGVYSWEMAKKFTLFGDPALVLDIVNPKAPVVKLYISNSQVLEGDFIDDKPLVMAKIVSIEAIDINSIMAIIDKNIFKADDPIVEYLAYNKTSGEVVIKPDFEIGEHEVRLQVTDTTGLTGEDRINFIVSDKLEILDVFNYPNPMRAITEFTYKLTKSAEVTIKIYTINGRLIKTIKDFSSSSFNHIKWDGSDQDGDRIANGVYLYKVIAKRGGKTREHIGKLAKIE